MKTLLGVLFIITGAVLGIYFGVFILFIGGILQFAHGLQPVNALELAWGIIKVFFSGVVGWLTFLLCFFIGGMMIET